MSLLVSRFGWQRDGALTEMGFFFVWQKKEMDLERRRGNVFFCVTEGTYGFGKKAGRQLFTGKEGFFWKDIDNWKRG